MVKISDFALNVYLMCFHTFHFTSSTIFSRSIVQTQTANCYTRNNKQNATDIEQVATLCVIIGILHAQLEIRNSKHTTHNSQLARRNGNSIQ